MILKCSIHLRRYSLSFDTSHWGCYKHVEYGYSFYQFGPFCYWYKEKE